jgi:hypothetical protein
MPTGASTPAVGKAEEVVVPECASPPTYSRRPLRPEVSLARTLFGLSRFVRQIRFDRENGDECG